MKEQRVTGYYVGKCDGGPRNGEIIEHWCDELYIYKPMRDAFDNKAPIEVVPLGHYYHIRPGLWKWQRS